jgi:hypothetical protein
VQSVSPRASDDELKRRFQLLKKDKFGNHNQLKSRACEECKKTNTRGAPLGILFWYQGGSTWPTEIPAIGKSAEKGCVGCGWYDLQAWREALNRKISK